MKPSLMNNTISETLSNSKASIELKNRLNNSFEVAIWSNEYDYVTYHQIGHHTLGLYLEGGYSTRRLDNKSAGNGAPNKFCLLPAGHHSEWEVGERQRFAHLYFSDSTLKRVALESFDMDPRLVELADRTYFDDSDLLRYCQSFVNQNYYYPEDRLAAHEDMWQILGLLLQCYCAKSPKKVVYRGGLTKLTLARIIDYINDHIDKKISVEELAVIAGVSPFHFIRMFKISVGQTPHKKIMELRVKKASFLLLSKASQMDAAVACGFTNQAHFSRTFKQYYGVTPGQFIRAKL